MTVTQPGRFKARLTEIRFGRLTLQHGSENLGRIASMNMRARRTAFTFLPGAGSAARLGGHYLPRSTILCHRAGRRYYEQSEYGMDWATLGLPDADWADLTARHGLCALLADMAPGGTSIVRPTVHAFKRLLDLHRMAIRLAQAGWDKTEPGVLAGLEADLIAALVHCCRSADITPQSMASRTHEQIMRKFSLAAASGVEEESTIVDLCAELDISPRTLRYCCQLHLGMGPKRFLTIRRLNLVRQALQAVGPSNLNVTQAATAYGFWELGRFAVAYRELFGEMPSVTLRRHTGDPLLASDSGPAPNGPGAPFGFAPQWVAAAC